MDRFLPLLASMARVPNARQAGYRHRLASKRISTLLEVEKSSGKNWSPRPFDGYPGSDPQHERCQFPAGCTKAPRRIAQAWNRCVQATVAKYMVKHRKPPSQTWRTFLENHVKSTQTYRMHQLPMSKNPHSKSTQCRHTVLKCVNLVLP